MRKVFIVLFLLAFVFANAQTEEAKLTATMKEFHKALVDQNKTVLNQYTENALSYGHSNGWVQNKTDLVKDFESGKVSYQSIREDSIQISMGDGIANVRFIGDFVAVSNGNTNNIHLKVLEVWVKKNNQWLLFARQAVR